MSILQPKSIPQTSGVYIFRNAKNTPIYIGKAANIKKRLVTYWRGNSSPKVRELLNEATQVDWIEVHSEIDALLKEAELIKAHYPKYNIVLRDDKNYFYVGVAKETYPRVFLTHQAKKDMLQEGTNLRPAYIGPFTSGNALKTTLRLLRGIFPYCTCKELHKRPCLNAEIGRCFGYCCIINLQREPEAARRTEYKRSIQNIIAVLTGRKKKLLRDLKKEMQQASQKQYFEKAAELRNQIFGIENILDHAHVINSESAELSRRELQWKKIERNIQTIFNSAKPFTRAEGYDISNISGTEATGSMVVFITGKPEKSEYRKFRIKTVHQAHDVAMHKEVMRRRLSHKDWPTPDLILIDGGKPQMNGVLPVVRASGIPGIHVAALAKREEELYIERRVAPLPLRNLPQDTALFFQHIRNESHRFAKKYHHKRREMLYREQTKK